MIIAPPSPKLQRTSQKDQLQLPSAKAEQTAAEVARGGRRRERDRGVTYVRGLSISIITTQFSSQNGTNSQAICQEPVV